MKNLLTSREFWVSILGLAVILIGQFMPGFNIDLPQAVALVIVIVSYLYGINQDPGPGGWRGWLQSRKFWAASVGFALIVLDGFHVVLPEGLTPDMLVALSAIIGGFIVSAAKQPEPEQNQPIQKEDPPQFSEWEDPEAKIN